ncbi:purple acid phosphatase 15-like [Hibiscus syriacus]|uniref:purple acid phosphatase 15-like n=1 Tax=Hibiscus syriacus TaxID=106335 RepID=UPI001923B2AF|nr:purple acid phosphatase 15-like [Hibiscus syriacus]
MGLAMESSNRIVPSFLILLSFIFVVVNGQFPTTLEGPFKPVTVPVDYAIVGKVTRLPVNKNPIIRPTIEFQPEQISLSLSSNFSSVWVSWIAGEFQIGDNVELLDPQSVASVVRYGVYRSDRNNQAVGTSFVYSQQYPIGGLENYTSGIIHRVLITGLEPDTMYEYQCGDPNKTMSDVHYFRTMPSPLEDYPSRIAVVGGLGLTYNTSTTISHMVANHPDLALLVGDLSFADLYRTDGALSDCQNCSGPQTLRQETFQPRWDHWGRFMQILTATVPTMVIEGEHEIEKQADNQTFAAYSSRFASTHDESGSTLYYSFDAGGIHFVMLGAYVPYDKSSDQYKWLERDLSNVNRSVTPWLIAAWSPPWYSTYKEHYREAECMRVEMEELLYKHGVDTVFNGQVNAYERSNRVYNYTLDPCGPVHITVGSGGNEKNLALEHADEPGNCPVSSNITDGFMGGFCGFNFTSGPAAGNFCWNEQPGYSAYRESSFGYGILEVKNQTHALWIWYRNQDHYSSGADVIYIVRQPDRCPSPTEGCVSIAGVGSTGFMPGKETREVQLHNTQEKAYVPSYILHIFSLIYTMYMTRINFCHLGSQSFV